MKAGDISEIKNFSKPPKAVTMVLEAVMLLLNRKKASWKTIKATVSQPKRFIVKLFEFDASKISEKLSNKLKKDYTGGPDWSIEKFARSSKAVASLGQWVESTLNLYEVMKLVTPKRESLKALQEAQADGQQDAEELKAAQKQLEVAQQAVETLKKEFEEAQQAIKQLKAEDYETRTQIYQKIVASGGQVPEQEEEDRDRDPENAAGDSLLSAAAQTYLGPLDNLSKNLLIDNWRRFLERNGLKFGKDATVADLVADTEVELVAEELDGRSIQFNVKQEVIDALLKAPEPAPAPIQAALAPTPTPAPVQAAPPTKLQEEFIGQLEKLQNDFLQKLRNQQ